MQEGAVMGRRGQKAAREPLEGERIRLSVRNFRRELRDRLHILKARRMAAGHTENLEDLYNLAVEEGLEVLESRLAAE